MKQISLALVCIVLFSSWAAADIRYRIRPRSGEVASTWLADPDQGDIPVCHDAAMIDRLWRTLFRLPTVTVREKGTIDIDLAVGQAALPAGEQKAYTTGKLVAYWDSSTPGIFFGVSIKERPTLPPRVEVVVVRESPNRCALKWIGLGDKY
jgi:hypothetical protein